MKAIVSGVLCGVAAFGAAWFLFHADGSSVAPANNDLSYAEIAPGGRQPYRSVTEHSVRIGGKEIDYAAIAGETILYATQGAPIGSIFSFSYIKNNPADSSRPVLFIFNGGPGAASIWLHMGAVGPKRVVLDNEVNPSNTPPFGVTDNPNSVLDVADLVFIDPVGTGFSQPAGEGTTADFWGVDEDANAVAQFIELWLTEHGRWNSPKYVMGESYGSIRAAVLPRALMGGPYYTGVMRGVTLNGIILLGTTLEARAETGQSIKDEVLANALALPSIAATAWYHRKGAKQEESLEALYAEAKAYAVGDYLGALRKQETGSLSEGERQEALARLVEFTGLSADDIGEDLVISASDFAKTILKGEGLGAGMYDSRYTLPAANSGGDPVADDPAMGRYVPGFIAAFHQMLHDDLGVALKRPYGAIVWKDLLPSWNWKRAGVAENQNFAVDLSWAMRRNEKLRLLVANGYYDLVTPPAMAENILDAVGIPADRVAYRNYESGHMLYLGDTSKQFSDDVRALITASGDDKAAR